MKYPHYFKHVGHLDTIDVYRVLDLFQVSDPCLQHAIKKLLVAGGRGHKDAAKDVAEAIVSLERWQAMRAEDGVAPSASFYADIARMEADVRAQLCKRGLMGGEAAGQ